MTTFTLASGSTFDLQDTTYNLDAAPIATPREEGFTLRNRINFSNVKSSRNLTADGSGNANILRILTVPSRTLIRALTFGVVPGSSAAAHAYTSASGSPGSSAKFQIGAQGWHNASQSTIKTSATAFITNLAITVSTGALTSTASVFGSVSSTSTPWAQQVNIGTSSKLKAVAFPFGGFVVMNIKNNTGSSAEDMTSAKLSGTLEIRAVCEFMPE